MRWQLSSSQEKTHNETYIASTLIMDFLASRTQETNSCCLSPPAYDILLWQPVLTKTGQFNTALLPWLAGLLASYLETPIKI